VDLQYLLRWLVKISLHLKALPKDGSPPPLFVSAGVESVRRQHQYEDFALDVLVGA
jgi:hypothetical protein